MVVNLLATSGMLSSACWLKNWHLGYTIAAAPADEGASLHVRKALLEAVRSFDASLLEGAVLGGLFAKVALGCWRMLGLLGGRGKWCGRS